MKLEELAELFKKQWYIFGAVILLVTPGIFLTVNYLYKNRIAEMESKIRTIEKKDNGICDELSEIISKAPDGEEFLKTFKPINSTFGNLSGTWEMKGEDIEVSEKKLEYSVKLSYTGECEIKQFSNFVTLIGSDIGATDDKSKTFHWNITGIGVITDYVGVYYHLYSKTMGPTCGVLLLSKNPSETELKGFFLAKRALTDDENGQKQGFGFGYAILNLKKK